MSLVSSWYNQFKIYFSNNHSRIYAFSDNHKSVIKFIISGSLAGLTSILFLFVFHGWLKIALVVATSLAFVLAFMVSFSLQKLWTFRNRYKGKIVYQLSLYLLNAFLGLSMNALFMSLLVKEYAVWYILAQIIVDLIIGFWNFVIYKFIIFKPNKNEIFV